MSAQNFLSSLKKHFYLSLCGILIAIGLFYAACVVVITIVPVYQQQIADEFSQLLKQPIKFSEISFKWRGLKLYAKVHNVDIGRHDAKIHIDNINKVQFVLYPIKSLINFKPIIEDITVYGGKIYLSGITDDFSVPQDVCKLSSHSGVESLAKLENEEVGAVLPNLNSSTDMVATLSESCTPIDNLHNEPSNDKNFFQLAHKKINQIIDNKYLEWISINKINLRDTMVLVNHQPSHVAHNGIEKEYVISNLSFYQKSKVNYLYAKAYQINKPSIFSNDRESMELVLELNKINQVLNERHPNKFYISTNSKGLSSLLNYYVTNTNKAIDSIELDNKTLLKIWGEIDNNALSPMRLKKELNIAIDSPSINIKFADKSEFKLTSVSGLFDYIPLSTTSNNQYIIRTDSLVAKISNSTVFASGNISKVAEDAPLNVNSIIRFGHSNLKQFFADLPTYILDKSTSCWLTKHVTRGNIGTGEIIWRGDLNNFPYGKQYDLPSGVFTLYADIIGVDIDYAPGAWPKISDIDGKLVLRGRDLTIDASSAKIQNSFISDLNANIFDLGSGLGNELNISGTINTTGKNLQTFIQTSELKNDLGILNNTLNIDGNVNLDMKLAVPLVEGQSNKIIGTLKFNDNNVAINNTSLVIHNLNGGVYFTEDSISDNNLSALFNNKPLNISLSNKVSKGTQANIMGYFAAENIKEIFNIDVGNYISGLTEIDVDLAVYKTSSNKKELYVSVNSDLKGMTSKLPTPYDKNELDEVPIALTIEHDFDDYVRYNLTLKNQDKKIDSRKVHNTIELNRYKNNDQIILDTNFAMGRIIYNNNTNDLTANLDKFIIGQDKQSGFGSKLKYIDYFNLPSLKVSVEQLIYNDFNWGSISFETESSLEDNIFSINKFAINNEAIRANIDAKRTHVLNNQHVGHFDGDLDTNEFIEIIGSEFYNYASGSYRIRDFSKFIDLLGYNSGSDTIRLNGSFQLDWHGDLLTTDFSRISGDLNIKNGQGILKNIEPGFGRIFSFFNLDVLRKRLKLDFSDVFEKGYYFDSVRGKLKLNRGVLTTARTIVQAASADIDIYGSIDINKKQYNIKADVTPHVTTSLPVAAAVVGTPVAGAAVFIVDKLLDSPVEQLTESAYYISGSWSDPKISKLAKKRGPLIEVSWLNPVLDKKS